MCTGLLPSVGYSDTAKPMDGRLSYSSLYMFVLSGLKGLDKEFAVHMSQRTKRDFGARPPARPMNRSLRPKSSNLPRGSMGAW